MEFVQEIEEMEILPEEDNIQGRGESTAAERSVQQREREHCSTERDSTAAERGESTAADRGQSTATESGDRAIDTADGDDTE